MSDSNFRKFLLDTIYTNDDKEIKGFKLSTEHQVLLMVSAQLQFLNVMFQKKKLSAA